MMKKTKNILFFQILVGLIFLLLWQLLSSLSIINSFIFSSPINIVKCIVSLYKENNLFNNILITLIETLTSFFITSLFSILISLLLYKLPIVYKIFEPHLVILNSLPKIALGPILIIWIGANINSIIVMGILISIIISTQNLTTAFRNTNTSMIKLLKVYNASELSIIKNVVIPSNYKTIFNTLKINISMSLVGVIMGEFLTSKEGLGYLILYGSQIFNLNLVMSGIIILIIISILFYICILKIEKKLVKN